MWKAVAKHWAVVVLLGVSLAVRLGYGLSRPADEAWIASLPDQAEYHAIAMSVLAGEGFGFTDERFGQRVVAFRSPGYPLFVAAMGGDVVAVRVAQAMVDTLSVLGVWLLVRRLVPDRPVAAVVAGGLMAVHPLLIHFSSLLLTETLTTALLVWGVYLLTYRSGRAVVAAAVVLGVAAMVRPSFWAVAMVMLGGRILTLPVPWLSRGAIGAACAGVMLAMVLPWAARNALVLGRPILTTTNSGITAYDGFNPDADGSSNQQVFLQDMPYLGQMTETDRDAYLRQQAMTWAAENPGRLLPLAAAKVGRTFSPVPLAKENRTWLYWSVGLAFLLPLMGLAVAGVVWSAIAPRYRLMLVMPIVVVGLGHGLSVGSMRYRVPIEPMWCVLAAGFVAAPRRGSSGRGSSRQGASRAATTGT
jgi:hypothetical protein